MTARIALALLFVIPAAMAYPWHTPTQRWVLGVAVAVVLLTFAWWGGMFLTTRIGRWLAVWRRNRGTSEPAPTNEVAVLLSVEAPAGTTVPLHLVAGYVDRFGIRCAKVRVTNLDVSGTRRTWIGMTLAANDNLAALRARSPELPLYDTAEVVGRRLSDQLRELGFDATIVDTAEGPWNPSDPSARETWRGMRDADGYLAAYAIPIDGDLAARLTHVWSHTNRATWTAIEFSGDATRPTATALCAIRTDDAPSAVPVSGLRGQNGRHRPLLTALDPRSVERLDTGAVPVPASLLDEVEWPVGSSSSTVGAHARP
jgi:type VII secretion protein EccE